MELFGALLQTRVTLHPFTPNPPITWGVALVTVALHGGVPLLLEGPVHTAPVLESVLGELVFGPDSCDLLLVFCRGTLITFDALAYQITKSLVINQ